MTQTSWATIDPAELEIAVAELSTVRDWVRFIVSSLRRYEVDLGQGTTDYFAEASALVMQPLNLEWSISPEILDAKILSYERQEIAELVQRRINERLPAGYLLNLSYFNGLPFYVDERVLIPRSPIAELIKERFAPYFDSFDEEQGIDFNLPLPINTHAPQRILDLCTGSGCIAIALAKAFEEAYIDAVDLSIDALEVASVNVEHHGVREQVSLIESDLLSKVIPNKQYDLMVSNPPYVDSEDMADLPQEFLHEPEMALAAGQDGLDIVLRILAESADYLAKDGLLVVEVGNSEWALQQLFPEVAFTWLNFSTGQHGVFALTEAQCVAHQALFNARLAERS